MTDRPILFSAPMVKALLDGTKTQTRRIINGLGGQPIVEYDGMFMWKQGYRWGAVPDPKFPPGVRFAVGDRLWVRESWRTFISLEKTKPVDVWSPGCGRGAGIRYEADGSSLAVTMAGERYTGPEREMAPFGKLRPGIFMPRWASRMTLVVTEVRVQRLQEISEADAIAEGIRSTTAGAIRDMFADKEASAALPDDMKLFYAPDDDSDDALCLTAADAYGRLWESINGDDGWFENPWVCAITFEVQQVNVAEVASADTREVA